MTTYANRQQLADSLRDKFFFKVVYQDYLSKKSVKVINDFESVEKLSKYSNDGRKTEAGTKYVRCFIAENIRGKSSGGSWRGGQAHYSSVTDAFPSFDFDELICSLNPHVTLISYKKIMRDLTDRSYTFEIHDNEYYGNYTERGHRILSIDDFIDVVLENNLVQLGDA